MQHVFTMQLDVLHSLKLTLKSTGTAGLYLMIETFQLC